MENGDAPCNIERDILDGRGLGGVHGTVLSPFYLHDVG